MPAEAKTAAPLSDANSQTPKKKQTSGKAALARITLLDGSILDVTIDVSHATFIWSLFLKIDWNLKNCAE